MLDPTRLKLSAESVGYQARFGRPIDWVQFDKALQTDYNNQGSAIQVRREKETPVNELHVMGAANVGYESNSLVLTNDRQARQINGYPLRHFSAENPAVVIPKKYGGLPMYTRNQVEYDQYVSRFTEPLSAQLDSSTALLSRAGLPALTEDIDRPYEAANFMNPMTSTKDELDQNQNVFRQQMHLQRMSSQQRKNKKAIEPSVFNIAKKQNILVNKDGTPVSTASDAIQSERAELGVFQNEQEDFVNRQLGQIMHQPSDNSQNQILVNSAVSDSGFIRTRLFTPSVTPTNRMSVNEYQNYIQDFLENGPDAPATPIFDIEANLLSAGRLAAGESIQRTIGLRDGAGSLFQYAHQSPELFIQSGSGVSPNGLQPSDLFLQSPGSPSFVSRRRLSMGSGRGSNRPNEILGFAVREANTRRARKGAYRKSVSPGLTPFKAKRGSMANIRSNTPLSLIQRKERARGAIVDMPY